MRPVRTGPVLVLATLGLAAVLVCFWMLPAVEPPPSDVPRQPEPDAPALHRSHTALQAAEAAMLEDDLATAWAWLAAARVPEGERSYRAARAGLLEVQALLAAGEPRRAAQRASTVLDRAVADDAMRARRLLADALAAAGRFDEAMAALLPVVESTWILYQGYLRESVLARLEWLARQVEPSTPGRRRLLLRLAQAEHRFARWAEGNRWLETVRWEELAPEAAAQLAQGLAQTGRWDRRRQVLEEALEAAAAAELPAGRLSPLRLQLAAEWRRRGDPQASDRLLTDVLRQDPGSGAAGEALEVLVRQALNAGDREAAWRHLKAWSAAARGTGGWRNAVLAIFATSYPPGSGTGGARPNLERARQELGLLAEAEPDPAYLYWTARLLTEHGMTAAGPAGAGEDRGVAGLVAELVRRYPLSYYTLAAADRWPELMPGPVASGPPATGGADDGDQSAGPGHAAPPPSGEPGAMAAVAALEDLHRRGLAREAVLELRYLVAGQEEAAPALVALLARWERELGLYPAAVSHVHRWFEPFRVPEADPGPPAAGRPDPRAQRPLPRWLLEALFPRPYDDLVAEQGRSQGVDPLFIHAVIRQESTFQPRALSVADAHGLMQLLPATARLVARGEGLPAPAATDLFDPRLNIRLGTAFLRSLMARYGDTRLATAAYHAGPGRVDRWRQTLGREDLELFVELIPIAGTRDYVKAVDRSYRLYRHLYGHLYESGSRSQAPPE